MGRWHLVLPRPLLDHSVHLGCLQALAKLTGPQKVERDKNTWFHWLGRYRCVWLHWLSRYRCVLLWKSIVWQLLHLRPVQRSRLCMCVWRCSFS